MGYLFMLLTLISGLVKGFCGKKVSGIVSTIKGTVFMNFFRMLICVIVGFFIVAKDGLLSFNVDYMTLLISGVSGIATAMFVVSWVFCVRRGAYVMIDVFLMLGGGLTIGLCSIFFHEPVQWNQLLGLVLLLIASYIMCSYSSNIKGNFDIFSFLLLVICGCFNGLSDFSQKWFVNACSDVSVGVFNFYTYLFATIILFMLFLIINKKEDGKNDGKSLKVSFVIGVMAICLFSYSYFKTMAAKYIPAALLYPLTSGVTIVLSAIMASVFFKEKITTKCIKGIVVAICAIVVMNL